MTTGNFTLESTIKDYPSFNYGEIKDAILGKSYELTLAFIGRKRAAALPRCSQCELERLVEATLGFETGERICAHERRHFAVEVDFHLVGERQPNHGLADEYLLAVLQNARARD